jgi:hypothetical protein
MTRSLLRLAILATGLLAAGPLAAQGSNILNPRGGDLLNPRGGDILNPGGAPPLPNPSDMPQVRPRQPVNGSDGPSVTLGPPPVFGRPVGGAQGQAMTILDGSGRPIGSVPPGWTGRQILRDATGQPIGIIDLDPDTRGDRRDGGYVVRDMAGRPIGRVETGEDPLRRHGD